MPEERSICLPVRPRFSRLRLFCLLLILITGYSCPAQELPDTNPAKWQVAAQLMINHTSVLDNAFSSIPFNGTLPGGTITAQYQGERIIHEWEATYNNGRLRSISAGMDLKLITASGAYRILYKFTQPLEASQSQFTIHAGVSLELLYTNKHYNGYINNDGTFETAVPFSAIVEAGYFFRDVLGGVSLVDRLTFPLFAYVRQPGFGSGDATGKKNAQLKSYDGFTRLKNECSIAKELTPRQRLALRYTWDYYRIADPGQIKSVSDRFGIIYSYLF